MCVNVCVYRLVLERGGKFCRLDAGQLQKESPKQKPTSIPCIRTKTTEVVQDFAGRCFAAGVSGLAILQKKHFQILRCFPGHWLPAVLLPSRAGSFCVPGSGLSAENSFWLSISCRKMQFAEILQRGCPGHSLVALLVITVVLPSRADTLLCLGVRLSGCTVCRSRFWPFSSLGKML